MLRFKFTYQDRALNKHIEIWGAQSWADAIVLAFSVKKAEWKLLMVECIPEEGGFKNQYQLDGEDLEEPILWPTENPYLNKKEK